VHQVIRPAADGPACSGGTTQRFEAHGCAAGPDAITQLRSEPIADEYAERLARARNVGEPGVEFVDIE
jgi:hypothetical protein